ncbi:MAG: hypothetical protein RLZZ393_1687, partial [Pseudomonadota bacterium]
MKKEYRHFLLALCVPALALISATTVVDAAPVKATRWSDRASWPNGKVPAAGDKVSIASGKEVILDVSPPAL